jgi:uroporphyrinogen-III synthase
MPPRILITRAPHQASALADGLRARGLEPVLVPTIEIAPPTTYAPLDAAIKNLSGQGTVNAFHWLLFTSANAVEAFAKRLSHPYSLLSHPCHVAAIGPATARAISERLVTKPTLVAPQAVAESLAEALLPHAKQPDGTPSRFLLVRAEQARDHLPQTLRAAGAEVTIAPAYRTVMPQDSLPKIRELFDSPESYPDAIVFTSSSTVTNLLALLDAAGVSLPQHIPRISIGPITSQTLRDQNLPPHAESEEPTVTSLVEKIARCFPTQTLSS